MCVLGEGGTNLTLKSLAIFECTKMMNDLWVEEYGSETKTKLSACTQKRGARRESA